MQRLLLVKGQGSAAVGVAELAAAGADIAANHEGGSASSPALTDVGASPAAADCMQAVGIYYPFGICISLVGSEVHLQPIGLPQVLHYYFSC